MASMGEMLAMMQGGQDRTGFADMADQYAYEKPDNRLAALKKAMEEGQGGGEEGGETGGNIGEIGGDEEGTFMSLGGAFDEYLNSQFGNNESEIDFESVEDAAIDANTFRKLTGPNKGQPVGFDKLNTPKSTGVPKTGTVSMPVDDLKSSSFNPMNILKFLGKRSAPGAILIPTDLGAADFPIDEETGMPIYPDQFGMADGGRVEMQQGGMPGGMAMPGLLGVASGSSGNLFDNYMPNPSAVPGPNYNTYQAPPLTSLASPYSGAQFGDIGDYLGGPDPYAVGYNPYVDMGGSAYDNYGLGMTQEDIDKVFADTDKFSLAAQEAKRKAAEAAAAAAAKAAQQQNTGGGGGGNYTPPGPSSNPAADAAAKEAQKDIGQGYGGQNVHG